MKGQAAQEATGANQETRTDPLNHTKQHETEILLVLLSMVSWIVVSASAPESGRFN
jgi:hypothetical protein